MSSYILFHPTLLHQQLFTRNILADPLTNSSHVQPVWICLFLSGCLETAKFHHVLRCIISLWSFAIIFWFLLTPFFLISISLFSKHTVKNSGDIFINSILLPNTMSDKITPLWLKHGAVSLKKKRHATGDKNIYSSLQRIHNMQIISLKLLMKVSIKYLEYPDIWHTTREKKQLCVNLCLRECR